MAEEDYAQHTTERGRNGTQSRMSSATSRHSCARSESTAKIDPVERLV
jgi:hypothetical protein